MPSFNADYFTITDKPSKTKNMEYIHAVAEMINSMMHTINGNTIFHEVKILQLNTGNGKWLTGNSILLKTIEQMHPDIVVISEGNMHIYDNEMCRVRRNTFKQFLFFDKIFPGAQHSRLTVMIRNTIEVQRLIQFKK